LEVPRELHGAIAVRGEPARAGAGARRAQPSMDPGPAGVRVAAGQRDAGAVLGAAGRLADVASDPIGAVTCRYSGDTHAEAWIPITAHGVTRSRSRP